MGNIYAIVNGSGALSGGFIDDAVNPPPLPSGAVGPLTSAQWQEWAGCPEGFTWNGTTVVAATPTPGPPTGYSTQCLGCPIISISTPAVNATYGCTPDQLNFFGTMYDYVVANAAFPGGQSSMKIRDFTYTTVRTFPTITLYKNFYLALVNFVFLCNQFDAGASVSLPGAQTIP